MDSSADPYYYTQTVGLPFEEVERRVIEALKTEGFGILTEIDVQATLKQKLDVDFRPYKILGACNPHFAHQALEVDDKIGTMLPCNVIVQASTVDDETEVAVVNPVASMQAVNDEQLASLAHEVWERLRRAMEHL